MNLPSARFASNTRILLLTLVLAVLSSPGPAFAQNQTAEPGSLSGIVTDSSGEYRLSDANVTVRADGAPIASERDVSTDRSGRFRFRELTPGQYTVTVDYIGGASSETTAVITAGDTTELAVAVEQASTSGLTEVLVRGQAAGQLSALNRRRLDDSIIDVLSSDSMGQFPDQNLAEALQRASGMSIQRDQGEGRFVVIRGIDPRFNSTTVNGLRIPGPEADSRAVNLDVISSDLIETVEINKSITPDMDGDAVGGNIEIKTLTAFDLPKGFTKLTVGGSYNATNKKTSPDVAGTWANTFSVGDGFDNFGVSMSFSKFDRKTVSDGIEGDGWTLTEAPNGQELSSLEEGEQRDYILTRDRTSVAVNFDYRPSDTTELYLRTLYSEFDDYETKLENIYKFADGDVEELDETGGRFTGAEMEKSGSDSNKVQEIVSISTGGESRVSDWTIDYSVGYSVAGEEGAIPEAGAVFLAEDVDIGYETSNAQQPLLFGYGAQTILDASAFALDEAELEDVFNEERELALTLNFRRDMDFGVHPGYIKFGAKTRLREKENDTRKLVFEGFGDDYTLADFASGGLSYPPRGELGPGLNFAQFRDFITTNQAQFEVNQEDTDIDSIAEDYFLEEDIHAAYLMAGVDMGDLHLVGGLRAEYTDYTASGTRLSIDEQSGSGDPVLEPFNGSKSYSDLFPSLAARYILSERMQLRGAVTRTISRPGFEDASPRQALEITEEDDGVFERIAEIGNPDLEPLQANNLDVRWEFYPSGASSVSAGFFYKDIDQFFVTTDTAGQPGAFADFDEVIQTINGAEAELFGLEFEYFRQFDSLPAPWNALLVGANYTFTDSEASLPGRDSKITLPGQSDHIGNLSLGFDDGRLSLRLSAAYRSEFFEEVNDVEDPAFDRYQDNHLQVDFTGKYRFSDMVEVYVNMININDEPLYAYFDRPRFNSQYEEYGQTYELGVTLQF